MDVYWLNKLFIPTNYISLLFNKILKPILFKKTAFLLIFISIIYVSNAQNIGGMVTNKATQSKMNKALVSILNIKDSSVIKTAITDENGRFMIKDVSIGRYLIRSEFIGFNDYYAPLTVVPEINRVKIEMEEAAIELMSVGKTAQKNAVSQKSDTLEFNSSSFKVNPDATVEDLVKKMPGITMEGGVLKTQGEEIKKVTVDGQDFFGDDASAALKNLPAELVSKVQVFDRMTDQSQFTGIDDGNSQKSLNIITKNGKNNGQFGKVYGGIGTKERFAAGGNINIFSKNNRLSVIGLSNNINQQNFSSEDLTGLLGTNSSGQGSSGRPQGGGRGQSGGGVSGSASSFLSGNQSGVNTTHSFGLNYNLLNQKRLKLGVSYFFNYGINKNETILDRTYFLSNELNQYYTQNDTTNNKKLNHRINARLEYQLDSFNSFIITPSFSFQNSNFNNIFNGNNLNDTQKAVNNSRTTNLTKSNAYNLNNSILWRKKFKNKTSSLSVNLTTGFNSMQSNNELNTSNEFFIPTNRNDNFLQQYNNPSSTVNLSSNISFSQILSKAMSIEVNYSPSYNLNKNDKKTMTFDNGTQSFSILDTLLSSKFNNTNISNRFGANYTIQNTKTTLRFGADYKITSLEGQSEFPNSELVQKSFQNILPNLMFTHKFDANKNFRIYYRSNTNLPSITNLQNVINNSNPLLLNAGNPNLSQDFNNFVVMRYISTNIKKGKRFFAMMNYSATQNYIGNSTLIANKDTVINNRINLAKGVQLSMPENLSGYQSFRTYTNYGLTIKQIKSNVNGNLGYNFTQTPALINGIKNLSKNNAINTGINLSSNISEKIDFNMGYNFNYNLIENTLQKNLNNTYIIQNLNAKVNYMPKNYLVINSELNRSAYSGLGTSFNQKIWLWNAGIGYKFTKSKRAEIKLSVFDILNQNKAISRTITENYIEDNFTKVLNRFYMLTFTYNVRNFKSNSVK